ncbi:MAG TPA: hypothetical protein PLN56_11070 [Methanoregulaceae archaeon]|nr:MAG: hypothetical protein IPI71_09565 [Methanolinea sp.]HON82469.1 hypothetical protein [Methanoregulaceae archaeon]HPD11521.1 hypothetical protein [Methanoregulaceae archaeon]
MNDAILSRGTAGAGYRPGREGLLVCSGVLPGLVGGSRPLTRSPYRLEA